MLSEPQTYNNDRLNEKAREVVFRFLDFLGSVDIQAASSEMIAASADAVHAASAVLDATMEEDDEEFGIH